ncbi:hypothetical protein [Methylobacterium sp. 10]|uniref:hypothetical protein n=1 Tax=Methylobacterium sp. 10 TaxID=1101191 RepID=UPI0012DE1228|nr:hypothetical protein [Methylobacterium sp. 10]
MQYQRVRSGIPTDIERENGPETKNAVAGVGARNGAKQKVSGKDFGAEATVQRPALASCFVALIEQDGTVSGVFHCRNQVRAFLRGGYA